MVPVTAVFTAPEPRTVVMRIVAGEGTGSVVETHATPLTEAGAGRPRCDVIETVVAGSDRRGFAPARAAAPSSARRGRPRGGCGRATWPVPSGAGPCGAPADSPAETGGPGHT